MQFDQMLKGAVRLLTRTKPKVVPPPKVITVDFPLPKDLQGHKTRLNTQTSVYKLPPSFLQKNNKNSLVGSVVRNQYIQTHWEEHVGKMVKVAGWVKSARQQGGNVLFIDLNDGSFTKNIQIVVHPTYENYKQLLSVKTAYCLSARGVLMKSEGKGQNFQIVVSGSEHSIKIFGQCDDPKYPLSSKYHKPETLRQVAHLRARTNLISAATRVKNNLAFATHMFFQNNGFYYIKTPLITSSDCQGAGEMFQVTTILPNSKQIKQVKTRNGKIQYNHDFFKKPAFLTVSGQLNVQTYCCGMSNVYTFGPTFRAEVSHTPRHMSEFWMIQPQLAFADLFDVIECAQEYIRFCIQFVLKNNRSDLQFFQDVAKTKQGLVAYMQGLIKEPFAKCSYSEAIDILLKCEERGVQFQNKVEWGIDLFSQHQKYLCGVIFGRPTVVYNYPSSIKSFYMRQNQGADPSRKTVANFDILAPDVGEIVGGSQREERYSKLQEKIKGKGMKVQDYQWYMDLRKYGTVPHGGFGLGFERLVMMCTGLDNIRQIVPFPRYPGNCDF